jgi:NDP-sugar pyrophosphorylase family protein
VLLAGGRGTRLAPYTAVLPKPLLPIDDLPVLEILLRQLHASGVRDVVLAVGHLAPLLEAYFGDGSRWNLNIRYSLETEPLGTAGPLGLVGGLTRTFLVMNGDLLTTLDHAKLVAFHRAQAADATVGVFRRKVNIELGVITTDGDDVVDYDEKPTLEYDVSIGAYVFEPSVLEHIPAEKKFDLPDLVRALMTTGCAVKAFRFEGHWLDIGQHDDYEEAIELFRRDRRLFLPDS